MKTIKTESRKEHQGLWTLMKGGQTNEKNF